MRFHRGRLAALVLLAPLLTGCEGWQSALNPHGPEARHLTSLFWTFTGVLGTIWLAVMITLAVALFRRPQARTVAPGDPLAVDPRAERRYTKVVTGMVGATAVTALVLAGISYVTQKRLFGSKGEGVTILVTGHQWWWEVRYEDPRPDHIVRTANEIHIPVGQPVTLKLESSDVIHSFWVPTLMGKQDLITGRQNTVRFTAERPGIYRGQCAEFCGLQHAHMAILVIAMPREEFDAWQAAQIKAADPPSDPERQRGQAIFLSKPCVMCHQVRGTSAGGQVAPELTHVGSRRYLAAGTVPMSRGNLAAWIVDPHSIKPGVNMPLIKLEPDELNAVSAYLEGLK